MLIPTFSPQGDGNSLEKKNLYWILREVDPYLFPARGRKHFYIHCQGFLCLGLLIPTFSPQGDGNPGR